MMTRVCCVPSLHHESCGCGVPRCPLLRTLSRCLHRTLSHLNTLYILRVGESSRNHRQTANILLKLLSNTKELVVVSHKIVFASPPDHHFVMKMPLDTLFSCPWTELHRARVRHSINNNFRTWSLGCEANWQSINLRQSLLQHLHILSPSERLLCSAH